MIKIAKLTLLCICLVYGSAAIAQIATPQPSPAGSVYSKVGLTDVTIDYFRPGVKGRKIFGEGDNFLQPYGNLWRTGANSGSKLTIDKDIIISGTTVAAGEYLIFTIPGKEEWSFMLYSDLTLGGNVNGYDKANEVLKTTVKATRLSSPTERLTFNISDVAADNTSASIEISWADVSIKVPFEVTFVDEVLASIDANTKVNPSVYPQAANFYLSQNIKLETALEYMTTYLAIGENNKQFWQIHTKARILAALDKKKEAIATAKESLQKAKDSPNGDFGYIKRNEDLLKSLK